MAFSGHYNAWRESRFNGLQKYMDIRIFKDKTLLELGCGYADIGHTFHTWGANVTSSDARKEHLEIVSKKYPHLKTKCIDADNLKLNTHYDIIVHWGVLYHLKDIEQHLKEVANNCDILLLETEVCDSDNPAFFIRTTENGYDQAFNHTGIRPSAPYVETILKQNGFSYRMITDPILNANFHTYDWAVENTNTWRHGLRRYWICWKSSIPSPLRSSIP